MEKCKIKDPAGGMTLNSQSPTIHQEQVLLQEHYLFLGPSKGNWRKIFTKVFNDTKSK